MYFTDDTLLPENQDPLMITAAPYGPFFMPDDYPGQVPVTWDEQVQAAKDCYNAGASILHIHVRDPKTGHISKNFREYSDQIGRLRQAVPKMVLQIGGSISLSPPPGAVAAKWDGYDTRHMLTEIDPKPDQITMTVCSTSGDMTCVVPEADLEGTHLADPKVRWQYANMVTDATPEFYIEHLKRLKEHRIQPYFALATISQLEQVERLIRFGIYMGPLNGFFSMVGGGTVGVNPFDWMELVRRTPHGSKWTYQTMFRHSWPLAAFMITLGQHTRAGIEENLWDSKQGKHLTSVQMVEKNVQMARWLGREIATGEDAHRLMKIGVWYDTVEETLFNLGLPPNRAAGQTGSVLYPTDGKLPAQKPLGSDGHPLAGHMSVAAGAKA